MQSSLEIASLRLPAQDFAGEADHHRAGDHPAVPVGRFQLRHVLGALDGDERDIDRLDDLFQIEPIRLMELGLIRAGRATLCRSAAESDT
jgi:hypothetical protein